VNVLVIGGTSFLGPHVVDVLLRRGHRVTTFNRGRNPAPSSAEVERVIGDRAVDIGRLSERAFDAVVDTCGYVPRVVGRALDVLASRAGIYAFVSTISVYGESIDPPRDETCPVARLDDATTEEITAESYGPLKALCESVVRERMKGRALVVRPGLIVGPLDPTDRFTYWPHRAAVGGEMLVPGRREHNISFIDVRDLAEFIAGCVERGVTGTFNASGDTEATTMGDLIDASVRAAGGVATPVWVDESFVKANDIAPWSELPAWIPTGEDSLMWASSARAVVEGLRYRPLDETVRATLEFTRSKGLDRPLKAGLEPRREADLLRRWHARPQTSRTY
jgi:nucleoside-diphosphate-sugar epimerase